MGLESAGHESDLIGLEHGLKEISSANIENMLDLIIARVLPETLVVKISLI